jgi:hypothetical protein
MAVPTTVVGAVLAILLLAELDRMEAQVSLLAPATPAGAVVV